MSLSGALQLANNALRAHQVGLQVVGQNIANANTPGYIREEVVFSPAPTQRVGGLLLGLGVEVTAVVQKIDHFLAERLRNAGSDRASGAVQEETYLQLEQLLGELSETDLSTSLNKFFNSISNVLNEPGSTTARNLAVLEGRTLAGNIQRLAERVNNVRTDINKRVTSKVDEINRLTDEIRLLNLRITEAEGSDAVASDAVGLRDQRGIALASLAELVETRVSEQPSGAVNVFVGGEYLVFEFTSRHVESELTSDRGLQISTIKLEEIDAPLALHSGELAGLVLSRDQILGGFLDQLDGFASTLALEFNRLYSSGQGLKGFGQLTSLAAVDDPGAALDQTGLPFTPVNGSFQVQVYNSQTGLTETTDIFIDLDGLNDDDTTLADLAAALNAVDGISAAVTPARQLSITSDAVNQQFGFAQDTSGILAALGLNTFFTGSTAIGLGVNQVLIEDPARFAASLTGIGEGTDNAVDLASFLDRPLDSQNGTTLGVLYDRLVGNVTQQASVTRSVADGFRVFEETLLGQHNAISGVSLDEEAVRMLTLQHGYQASARFIATISELLEMLVNL